MDSRKTSLIRAIDGDLLLRSNSLVLPKLEKSLEHAGTKHLFRSHVRDLCRPTDSIDVLNSKPLAGCEADLAVDISSDPLP